jgi:enamine deaminase RidA (YjgF/YER057c/UK114 family)
VSRPFDLINPRDLGEPRGFAHGLVAPVGGRLLFVAGQIGAETDGRIAVDGFVEQFERALARVLTVVHEAGGEPQQIARMTVYVTTMERYRASRAALRDVWQRHMGSHYPAMALVAVTALVDPQALVEIDATAVLS